MTENDGAAIKKLKDVLDPCIGVPCTMETEF